MVSVSCLDTMAFTDTAFDINALNADSAGRVQTSAVMAIIALCCGYGAENYSITIPSWITYIPAAEIEDKSCADILTMLSECLCGYFYTRSDNVLAFVPYGTAAGVMNITQHTALEYGDEYTAEGVRVTSGEDIYTRGDTSQSYNVISISSDLACDDTAKEVWNRAQSKKYDCIRCEKCILPFIPSLPCDVTFGQDNKVHRIMSAEVRISSGGMLGSLSTAAPTGGEISRRGRLTRTVDSKVQTGKKYGCMRMTAYQGLIFE